jgi:hypothetical protein
MSAEQVTANATGSGRKITTERVDTRVAAFGLSYAVTSVFSALLVVLKESNEAVLSGLAGLTGHHWVTHGLLDLIVFLALGLVLVRRGLAMTDRALVTVIVGSTVLSGLIIAGYFL